MKQVLNFLLVFLISISSKAQQSKKTEAYRMKDIAIQTRWAKDVGPNNALKEYPRPQLQRGDWINLNGLWDYAIVNSTSDQISKYDGKILVPFPLESALSGVRKSLQPDQVLWYHRTFHNPAMKSGEKLLLNFGAVSWEATVYVNEKEAGKHTGSYTAFSLDITGLLKTGQNDIRIKVSNPLEKGIGPRGKQTLLPNTMWYTASSGIWQTVWLEKVPGTYIKSIKVTPDVDKGIVNLFVNGKGKVVVTVPGCSDCKILEQGQGENSSMIILKVPNAKLWSPDSPHLYNLIIKLGDDEVKSYFGMRKIEIKKDNKGIDRIFLNNKYTYNLGTLDQGFWPEGLYTATTDEALKFDIEAIKAMGFNTIRKHIKVEPARWYYHADKLGMLVWQDLVQPGGKMERGGPIAAEVREQFQKESQEILTQFSHFPSITTWVLFNERWGEHDQDLMARWVKDNDPTRLLNGHSGAVIVDGKVEKHHIDEVLKRSIGSDMTDVHSYPSPALPNYIAGKAMVLGEFGGIGVRVEGHLWDDLQAVFGYGETISSAEMAKKYSIMTDSLVKFEKQGLSASIYTQPYDVEGEQNGLMTYDRQKIKMPLETINQLNSKLWSATVKSDVQIEFADSEVADLASEISMFKAGKRDSTFLRRLTVLSNVKKDSSALKAVSDAYIKQLKKPLSEINLRYIKRYGSSSSNKAFEAIKVNRVKVNEILGKDEQQKILMEVIYKEGILPKIKGVKSPDWDRIEKELTLKYPTLSNLVVEKVLFAQIMRVYNVLQDWEQVASLTDRWFNMKDQVLISGDGLNQLSWTVFDNISDPEWLKKALNWSKRSIDLEPRNELFIDTYASLLYKLGRKEEALEWEKKAVEANPSNEDIKKIYEKMQSGIPIWTK